MGTQFLTLTPTNRAGTFNRSTRDEKGAIKEQMTFQVGVFVDIESISKQMSLAICDDIGNQILVALPNENGVPKISFEATNQMVLEIAQAKVKKNRDPKNKKKISLTSIQLKAIEENEIAERLSSELEQQEAEALRLLEEEEAKKKAEEEAKKSEDK